MDTPTTPEGLSRAVARAVSDSLAAAGISQRDAAQRTGIPLTTLSRRLSGASPFNTNELAAIACLTNTTSSELVARAEVAA